MKTHINLSVDSYILEKAKESRINISQICEDAIRVNLNMIKGDLAGIDIDITRKRLEREESELRQLQSSVVELRAIITKWEEVAKQEATKALEKQKKEVEKLSKCQNCGQILPEKVKRHKFVIGAVCNACFLTADADCYKKWNTTQ